MERKKSPQKPSNKGTGRDERLKAALKANMARRKSQARARANGGAPRARDSQEE